MGQLTALRAQKVTEPGKYPDGKGLILQVTKGRSDTIRKSWLVRFSIAGKQREMGLGTFPEIGLADARAAALDVRAKALKGMDPIRERAEVQAALRAEAAKAMTFSRCAEMYIASHERGWANPKHRQQWRNTLSTYAYPVIGTMDVADVGVSEVMQILEPIWYTKTETASRLRGRLESILSWAIVRGHRAPPNPAVWRGHLDSLLPKPSRVHTIINHPALDWREMPGFMADLSRRPGTSARALEFTILTAARSGEVRKARWEEIDWRDRLWIVPAERMKMRREHRVPLSGRAISLLQQRRDVIAPKLDDLLFFHSDPQKPYSDEVYRALFQRMKRDGLTAHGFRSSFRDWAGEATNHARETAELALAHRIGNDAERRYRRGDALQKRRKLMDDWADYLTGPASSPADE